MYTFDSSLDTAQETYTAICEAYRQTFSRLELPVLQGWKTFYKTGSIQYNSRISQSMCPHMVEMRQSTWHVAVWEMGQQVSFHTRRK